MTNVFPDLNALAPQLPKAPPATEWVGRLGQVSVAPTAASGWVPTNLETVVAPDPEIERQAAYDTAFAMGYAQGQKAGRERGLAEGRRTGRDEGREEARQMILEAESGALQEFAQALEATLETVGPAVQRWQEAVETRAAELAMDAVRALLANELATQRPDAMGIVREALGFAEGSVRATIRLAPFDRAALAERREEILQACAGLRDIELVDDRSLEGGCIVETEQGVVDATLATRLSLLEAA
jgi:flagellar assembly protein FliH